jgi:integrase
VKNVSSNRDVPIHSHLLELGFLEYVQRLPADGRLFPQLNASGHKATYSARLGVWWGKYLENTVKITRSGISRFHSFRHTFMTHCRAVGLREDVQNAITGHSQHTDRTHTGRNYGVYPLAVKQEAIEQIPRLALTRPSQE